MENEWKGRIEQMAVDKLMKSWIEDEEEEEHLVLDGTFDRLR